MLKNAELVVESVAGTRRLYRINHAGLSAVREYFDWFWEITLDNFAILAAAEADACHQPHATTRSKRPSRGRSEK